VANPVPPSSLETIAAKADAVTGPDDVRVNLLRLAVPDLVVADGLDHERQRVGSAWNDGTWTAVLLVEPAPALITQAGGAPGLPLSSLALCLKDRGVVLDSIQMIWHCYPGSAALPSDSPALSSYMEVLGPLPAAARRTTWVAIRLDPAVVQHRCGSAAAAWARIAHSSAPYPGSEMRWNRKECRRGRSIRTSCCAPGSRPPSSRLSRVPIPA
jgi:type VII secretion protein EccE